MRIQRNRLLITGRILVVIIILFISGVHILDGLMQLDDGQIREFFKNNDINSFTNYVKHQDCDIRYVKASSGYKDTCIIFIHGAPGSWDAFKDYMVDPNLLNSADMIAYDRPGYGASKMGFAKPSLNYQSEVLTKIKDRERYDDYILVSHSYGGPIATLHALEYPQNILGNILIAPAIDPLGEKEFWFSGLFHWRCIKWIWPQSFQVAGEEKFHHVEELENLGKEIGKLKVPTLLIHSLDDWIVPAKPNIDYLNSMLDKEILNEEIYEDKGHLLIWTDHKLVIELILKFIKGELKEND